MNCAIKTKIMQECNLVTIQKGSCGARRIISLLRSEMNFIKNNHFVLVVQPQVFVY